MSEKDLKTGDLVVIDINEPAWNHLKEKESKHPLKHQGVITEVREKMYVVKFDKWVAYLKESDLKKISE